MQEPCKNEENTVNANAANTSGRQNTKKKLVNYSMFGRLITKNAGIYTVFEMSRKRGRHETL